MAAETPDALILGAGVAGLAAARDLSQAGRTAVLIEARDRIGGRIHTLHDPASAVPIELGAEFVHGRPPETWEILRAAGMTAYDVADDHWLFEGGVLRKRGNFWDQIRTVMDRLSDVKAEQDLSFDQFVKARCTDAACREATGIARSYVEGFNAADATRVSAHGLAEAEEASDRIDGTTMFRLVDGYDRLLQWLRDGLDPARVEVRLRTIALALRWEKGRVTAGMGSPTGDATAEISARAAIVTLPLGVLQCPPAKLGAVRFAPDLPEKRDAASRLAMGPVVKVILRFREAFWEGPDSPPTAHEPLTDASFFHAPGDVFPTWWTLLPLRVPMLVGWSGGPAAMSLTGRGEDAIVRDAVSSLSRLFGRSLSDLNSLLESAHVGDWNADPFARGAYGYVPVGALDAAAVLARPVQDTLFFAGEATHYEGMSGTVAGAIATGRRAAAEVLNVLR